MIISAEMSKCQAPSLRCPIRRIDNESLLTAVRGNIASLGRS